MKAEAPPDPPSGGPSPNDQASDARGKSCLVSYRNFLVPIDFSEHSKETIEYATQLAALTGAIIKLLHVFQIPEDLEAFYQGLYIESDLIKNHMEMAKRKTNEQLSVVTEQILAKGFEVESILRFGNPYEEIVNAAKELGADLIVIGSHGSTGLGRLLLGSTAERVLRYAPCAVLVVKDTPGGRFAARETAKALQD
jgi:universal stress protein A